MGRILGFKQAFTLAELMIVLTIIGVLVAILIPNAFRNVPDENIMKFKKAHNTLAMVIGELVSNNKYYCEGDLGLKPDCTTLVQNTDGMRDYFCKTIADLMSTKSVNCVDEDKGANPARLLSNELVKNVVTGSPVKRTVTSETIAKTKKFFDTACKNNAQTMGAEIISTDNVAYYQSGTSNQFGTWKSSAGDNGLAEDIRLRYFSPPGQHPANYGDQNGLDISYKVFCMDIDGIGVGEDPFGYGIRADGKILNGARADAWVKKSVQQKD